jgi:hypothetical protein
MSDFCFLFLAVVAPIAIVLLIFYEKKQDNAVFYANHFHFTLNSKSIRKATKMLTLHSSTNVYFTGETAERTEALNECFHGKLRALKPEADGRVHQYNFFELALAFDTHLHPKCYWMIHQKRPALMQNKFFVYQTEMRDAISPLFSTLAVLDIVEGPAPLVFKRFFDLLNPWQNYTDLNKVLALFFVWRRASFDDMDACFAVANLSEFENKEKNIFSLKDWMQLIHELAVAEKKSIWSNLLDDLISEIDNFDAKDKTIDNYEDSIFAVTNSMLNYLHTQFS